MINERFEKGRSGYQNRAEIPMSNLKSEGGG